MNSEVTKIQDHGPDMAHLISVVSTLERKQKNYFSEKLTLYNGAIICGVPLSQNFWIT